VENYRRAVKGLMAWLIVQHGHDCKELYYLADEASGDAPMIWYFTRILRWLNGEGWLVSLLPICAFAGRLRGAHGVPATDAFRNITSSPANSSVRAGTRCRGRTRTLRG
jgi:hypothetical protein